VFHGERVGRGILKRKKSGKDGGVRGTLISKKVVNKGRSTKRRKSKTTQLKWEKTVLEIKVTGGRGAPHGWRRKTTQQNPNLIGKKIGRSKKGGRDKVQILVESKTKFH